MTITIPQHREFVDMVEQDLKASGGKIQVRKEIVKTPLNTQVHLVMVYWFEVGTKEIMLRSLIGYKSNNKKNNETIEHEYNRLLNHIKKTIEEKNILIEWS